jgi:hypothetical protein
MKQKHEAILGLIAIQNVQLTERTYSNLRITAAEMINQQSAAAVKYPFQSLPIAPVSGTDLTVAYPALGLVADDVGVHVAFNIPPAESCGLGNSIPVLGYHTQIRFNDFTVSNDIQCMLRYGASAVDGSLATYMNRNITVSPTGGPNTNSEFIILNVVPFLSLSSQDDVAVGVGTAPAFVNPTASMDGILAPVGHRIRMLEASFNDVVSSMLIFKSLGSASLNVNIQVTPILNTIGSLRLLSQMLSV